jgi:uncharacterized caspase-like protein
MKSAMHHPSQALQSQPLQLIAAAEKVSPENRKPLVTRFGDAVDVRNRGALRISRLAGSQMRMHDTPAVVRLWTDEQCHELSAHNARALAAQLLAAAALADTQNGH